MNIRCTKNNTFVIYEKDNNKYKPIKINECVERGTNLIQSYLKEWNLVIRPIDRKDCENITKHEEILDDLCGEAMSDSLGSVIEDMNDIKDPSFFELDNMLRLTYVICPTNKKRLLLGIISAVINYRDTSLKFTIKPLYKEIKKYNTLYIEIMCNYQNKQYKECTVGTNYFLNAYVILHAFKVKEIRKIWASASGSSKIGELKDVHIKRGCSFIEDSKYYYCDPINFLNIFFERIEKKTLLTFAKKCNF
jgi:hypothetical protein